MTSSLILNVAHRTPPLNALPPDRGFAPTLPYGRSLGARPAMVLHPRGEPRAIRTTETDPLTHRGLPDSDGYHGAPAFRRCGNW